MTFTARGRSTTSACNGSVTLFPVDFQYQPGGLYVYLLAAASDGAAAAMDNADGTLLTEGTHYTVAGDGEAGTAAITTAVAYAAGLYIRRWRETSRDQAAEYAPGPFPATPTQKTLDRAAMTVEEIAADQSVLGARAVVARAGESGGTLPADADLRGKFLTKDADGNWVASDGGGADDALRTDLVASTGGVLLGTSYGSAQAALDQLFAQDALYHRARPPMPDGADYFQVWPSSTYQYAGARDAGGKFMLHRVYRVSNGVELVDQWILYDPNGLSGIAGGWFLWHEATFVLNGRFIPWHTQPAPGYGPIADSAFAINFGPMAQPYSSAGTGAEWFFAGDGHGRMLNTPASNQIQLDGAGANLQDPANWVPGTAKNGQVLDIACTYTLLSGSAAAHAGQVLHTQTFGQHSSLGNQGLVESGVLTALLAGHGYNDSYTLMSCAQRIYADRAKLGGDTLEIPLVGDGVQKGNWNGVDGTTVQFFNSGDRRFSKEAQAIYGPPSRINGSDTPHWARNSFGRTHMQDAADTSKFRMPAASSIEPALGRTAWALPLGDSVSWLTYRRCQFRTGGPL